MTPIIEFLPNEPLFHHVLSAFTTNPNYVLICDRVKDTEANCIQLLTDMVHMRRQIVQALPSSMIDSRNRITQERPFFLILAPGNYDFLVAAFGILCCGAAFAPISSTLSLEEASYVLKLSNAQSILFSPEFEAQALEILQYEMSQKSGQKSGQKHTIGIPISANNKPTIPAYQLQIDSDMSIDPLSPGSLIFTSGTTGPPKGIVRPRSFFYKVPESFPTGGVGLTFRPPNWAGVMTPLIVRALHGIRIEVMDDSVCELWERFKTGGVTHLLLPPAFWARLMRHFHEHLDALPSQEREKYVRGVQTLRRPVVTGNFTWPKVMDFWRELLGRPLLNIYGSTEAGTIMTSKESASNLDRCIGKPGDEVQVKLSNGDFGEILVKTPSMFTQYLGNPAATLAAFDEDRFYRTGDFGRLVGDQYVLDGRTSTDIIRRAGLWIPLQEVEARLVELAYVSEAYVVMADYNCAQQAAALIRISTTETSVNLLKVRKDLHDTLPTYKLPTLLRILKVGEGIPETSSGKPIRKKIAEKYFPLSIDGPLPPTVEFWDGNAEEVDIPRKHGIES